MQDTACGPDDLHRMLFAKSAFIRALGWCEQAGVNVVDGRHTVGVLLSSACAIIASTLMLHRLRLICR